MSEDNMTFWKRFVAGWKDCSVIASLEADLYPIGGSKWGEEPVEIEYTTFASGRTQLEIEIERKLKVPVGDNISIWINGVKLIEIPITGSKQDIQLNSTNGDSIPEISLGDRATVQHNGNPILEGKFKRD